MRRSKNGLAALVLATLMAPAAQAESLTVVEVNAPAVNCVFNTSCTVTVNDSTGALAMPLTRRQARHGCSRAPTRASLGRPPTARPPTSTA